MNVTEAIRTRRSVREFASDPVPQGVIEEILDAARFAPSSGNSQPWRFLVVSDRESLSKLQGRSMESIERRIDGSDQVSKGEKANVKVKYRSYADRIFGAPVFVFVFVATDRYPEHADSDGALAVGNLLLAAHALGYGASYQTSLFPSEAVCKLFGVPDGYRFICAVPVGKPAAVPEPPGRRPLVELVWYERYPERDGG
jgi:nitroreductase